MAENTTSREALSFNNSKQSSSDLRLTAEDSVALRLLDAGLVVVAKGDTAVWLQALVGVVAN